MRIIHTCLRYPPATGGAETYVEQLVTSTRDIEAHRDVRVVTSKLKTHAPISVLSPEALLDDPPYVQRLHHARTPLLSYPRLQALQYYLGHHRPDIIHGYSFWYHPADAAARYARKHRIPFIFHPIFYQNDIRQKPLWQVYAKTIGRRTFAAADVVVTISPYEQSLITKAGFPVKRFALIPPAVDSTRFQQPTVNPYPARNITGKIILTVNRLTPSKGLADLITALPAIVAAVPEAQLVIVGEDFGGQHALRQQAQRLGLTQRIHFTGKLTPMELIGAYQYADVLIHPSHYEAFGIVPAESLAAGTPVVARHSSAIPYVVPHDVAGLLFTNPAELITHTITILTNHNLASRLARDGQLRVQQLFSPNGTRDQILALYQELTPAVS